MESGRSRRPGGVVTLDMDNALREHKIEAPDIALVSQTEGWDNEGWGECNTAS